MLLVYEPVAACTASDKTSPTQPRSITLLIPSDSLAVQSSTFTLPRCAVRAFPILFLQQTPCCLPLAIRKTTTSMARNYGNLSSHSTSPMELLSSTSLASPSSCRPSRATSTAIPRSNSQLRHNSSPRLEAKPFWDISATSGVDGRCS